MKADEIWQLISMLPNIFIYIVPGYIFTSVYNYIFCLKGKDIKESIFKYVMISFIINTIAQWILGIFHIDMALTNTVFQICICIGALFLSYIWSMFSRSSVWVWIMNKLKINRSNASNIFSEMLDLKYGTWVRVYISSEKLIYDGAFLKYDHKGSYNDSMIILSEYIVYKYGESTIDENLFECEGKSTNHVIIKLSEISRIEVTYHPCSKKVLKEKNINNMDNKINEKEICTDSESIDSKTE